MHESLETIIYSLFSTGYQDDILPILLTNKSVYNSHFLWSIIINKSITKFKSTLLMNSAIENNYNRVKFILECNPNINLTDNDKNNALIYAFSGLDNTNNKCEDCNLNIIEALCKNNINLDQTCDKLETPIFYAIRKDYDKAVEILCNYNFNINHKNKDNKTAMSLAIELNNVNMCYYLWKKGANINTIDNKYHTFLMTAVYNELDYEKIEEIIKHKPLINALDINGCSALNYAIKKKNIKLIKLLINNKADVNSVNTIGESCLMYAVAENNIEIINILCDNKVNINYISNLKESAIKYAKKFNYNDIEKLLKTRLIKI